MSRWISIDPILGSYINGKPNGGVYNPININLYSYAADNPILYVDPDGKRPVKIFFGTTTNIVLGSGKTMEKGFYIDSGVVKPVLSFLNDLTNEGYKVRINSAYRTQEDQYYINHGGGDYASSSMKKQKGAYLSRHCQNLAIDISVTSSNKNDYRDKDGFTSISVLNKKDQNKIYDIAKKNGLRAGMRDFSITRSDGSTVYDFPHFDFKSSQGEAGTARGNVDLNLNFYNDSDYTPATFYINDLNEAASENSFRGFRNFYMPEMYKDPVLRQGK